MSGSQQSTHLKIGQLLLHKKSQAELQENILQIVNQFNIGIALLSDQTQRNEIAKLNLAAGHKARASNAYELALKYLSTGIELFPADSWENQYETTLSLYTKSAEAAYLSGHFETARQLIGITLQNTKSLLDELEVYEIGLNISIAEEKFLEAIESGLKILKLLKISVPIEPTENHLEQAFSTIRSLLVEQDIKNLFYLHAAEDPYILAAIKIFNILVVPTYQASLNLFLLNTAIVVELSIRYGNSPLSPTFYSLYGMILCCISNDIDRGYEFGLLALDLLNQSSEKQFYSRALLFSLAFVLHWKSHPENSLMLWQKGYGIGLETGDLDSTAWHYFHEGQTSYVIGQELSELNQKMAARNDAIQQIKYQLQLELNKIQQQSVLNLIGKSENPCSLIGEAFNEEESLPKYQATNSVQILHCIHFHKLILCVLFSEYSLAVNYSAIAARHINGVLGQVIVPTFYYYDSLAHLAVASNASELEQKNILEVINQNQKKLEEWSRYAPMNYQHKVDLVEAERCRLLGQKVEAIDFYDKAISGAKTNGYIQEEALANELAAKFCLDWGKEKIAQDYLTNAYYSYARWGAKAKSQDLERRYPQLLAPILQQQQLSLSATETVFATTALTSFQAPGTQSSSSGSTSISAALDLATVLKASQTLSSEIQLDKLLATLLHTVLENAGADKGALLMPHDHQWFVEAVATVDQPARVQSIPLSSSPEIPHSLIHNAKRSLQPVVIVDATTHPTLATNAYIVQQQPKSLLCTPILQQGKLVAILYLENRVTAGAFTRDRVKLLNFLCAQAAISLENARLYQQAQDYAQQLEQSHLQIVQSEKMASLGNLVAGVAHEINNPIGFLHGSINYAKDNVQDLLGHLELYQQHHPSPAKPIQDNAANIDLEFLCKDLPKLLDSMRGATDRITGISASLRTFSRSDTEYQVPANLHEGIDSTLLILKYRLKANEHRPAIQVIQDYGDLPDIECFPGQLNQVFMNILANAIDMFDEMAQTQSFDELEAHPQQITIRTTKVEDQVQISIQDNGKGMKEEIKIKIFNHLFTTKGVGKGTGLGLAIAKQIVVEKHGGSLDVQSEVGQGSKFCIRLPIEAE